MASTKPALLVLAAGMGSRYGGLKQLDPVGPSDELIIDYSVYDALRAGFGKVVFLIRRDIEDAFREQIGSRYEGRIEVAYAYQELDNLPQGFTLPEGREKPWGTGHAVMCAADVISEPFAVINADDFYGRNSYSVMADMLKSHVNDSSYSMVGFRLSNTLSENGTVARGICTIDGNGMLEGAEELTSIAKTEGGAENTFDDGSKRILSGDEIVSMNMWGFMPSVFPCLNKQFSDFLKTSIDTPKSEFFIPSVVNDLIKSGSVTVKVLPTESSWFGVTYREDKEVVVSSIKKLTEDGEYPSPLWN